MDHVTSWQTCLYLVNVHQMAPPLTVMAYVYLQLIMDPERMKG